MSASSPLKVDFSELNEWLPYTIDSRTIFGSFSHVKEAQKITLCFSTLKGCPVVVIFDAKDIKKQAAGQGIVVESDITEQVAHLLREPSKALQIHIDENQVVLEITISRDITLSLTFSACRLEESQISAVFRALSCSLFNNLIVFKYAIDDLERTISHKDNALSFLADSVEDAGFKSVIKKWAPIGSFNDELLRKFNLAEWLHGWGPPSAGARGPNDISSTFQMMQVIYRNLQMRELHPKEQLDDIAARHEYKDDSYTSNTNADAELSNNESTFTTDLLVKAEKTSSDEHRSETDTLLLKRPELLPVSDLQSYVLPKPPSPTPEIELQSSPSPSEDRSPNRKRRRFGKVKIE